MSTYNKPYLTIAEQIELLKSRGLVVNDVSLAEHYLSKVGYYRLSGYSYVFRQIEQTKTHKRVLDTFKADVIFEDIVALYVFDKKLRLILLDAIERIEIALRVDISQNLGRYDLFAHLRPQYLHNEFVDDPKYEKSRYDFWKEKYDKAFKDSREDFIVHFKNKYAQSDLPIWMATELWDFGMLSKYFEGLKDEYKAPISKHYQVTNYKVFESWLRTINVVRNICAHHGRLITT